MSLRTPIARAKGLGSAKEGVSHWWAQRVTAVALVPLTLWFVVSVIDLAGADHAAVVSWLSSPLRAALAVLFLVVLFHHANLGLQVVIEDYVHHEGSKTAALLLVTFAIYLSAATAVIAVLKIAFGG
jgi:succinate dehydrogenase / fumarate reductase membrane anchor subunit